MLSLIPFEEFQRVRNSVEDSNLRLTLLADMCRANAMTAVKKAGSGHLGSSFSSLDIVARLYFAEMNVVEAGLDDPDRIVFEERLGDHSANELPGIDAVAIVHQPAELLT